MIVRVENNQPDNVLRIEYMLGNTCNQKCSYCFPGSNEGNMPWPELKTVKNNLKKVLDHYKANGKTVFNIFFVGGEPTLWDDFLSLCEWLKEKYECILEISTNATRGIIWWTKAGRVLDHVNISMHHEYAKVNKIKKLADYLYQAGVFVNVDVLMDPHEFEKCEEIVERLITGTYNWPVIAKVVLYNGQTSYDEKQLKYFEDPIKQYPENGWFEETTRKPRTEITITNEDGEKFITKSDSWITRNNLNYFKGWSCNLGVDHIKITNGIITGNCQQPLFDKVYNINDRDFEFSPAINPVVCSKNICGCTGEIGIKKWKF
jgi:MoaA/NifB/PqqE/SkfB family radical SAM enzyme